MPYKFNPFTGKLDLVNDPTVISKTYSELATMVAGSSLVVGQQYKTQIYTKYFQAGRNKMKICEYDYGTENLSLCYEDIILTASSTNTFETKAISLTYAGHELDYDFTNNLVTVPAWNDTNFNSYFVGEEVLYNGVYYRAIADTTVGLTPDVTPTEWEVIADANYAFRPGWIIRRIDTIKRLNIRQDYERLLFARYDPDLTNIPFYNSSLLIESSNIISGLTYQIVSQATIDFTLHGSVDNVVGTKFVASDNFVLGVGDSVYQVAVAYKIYQNYENSDIYLCKNDITATSVYDTNYFNLFYTMGSHLLVRGFFPDLGTVGIVMNADRTNYVENYCISKSVSNNTTIGGVNEISNFVFLSTLDNSYFGQIENSTFSSEANFVSNCYSVDGSIIGSLYKIDNVCQIDECYISSIVQNTRMGNLYQTLVLGDGISRCVFDGDVGGLMSCGDFSNNIFFGEIASVNFLKNCNNNLVQSAFTSNIWKGIFAGNSVGYACAGNVFEQDITSTTIGNVFVNNIGYGANTISYLTIGSNVSSCTFDSTAGDITSLVIASNTTGKTYNGPTSGTIDIGDGNDNTKERSVTVGSQLNVQNSYSTAVGSFINTYGYVDSAFGRNIDIYKEYSQGYGASHYIYGKSSTALGGDNEIYSDECTTIGKDVRIANHRRNLSGNVLSGYMVNDQISTNQGNNYVITGISFGSLAGLSSLVMPDTDSAEQFDYRFVRALDSIEFWNNTTSSSILKTTVSANVSPSVSWDGSQVIVDNTGCTLTINDAIPAIGYTDADEITVKYSQMPLMIFDTFDVRDFSLLPKAWIDLNFQWHFPNQAYDIVSGNTTLDSTKTIVEVDSLATITLPTAVGIKGRKYNIIRTGTSNVTIQPDGSETISGDSNLILTNQWDSVVIYSNGTNWVRGS